MYSESSISHNIQEIMRGIGMIQGLLEILEVNLSIQAEDGDIPSENVNMIFYILALVMQDNEENQLLILKKFRVICSYFIGSKRNENTLFVLLNIVKDNKKVLYEEEICKSILDLIKLRIQEIETDSI